MFHICNKIAHKIATKQHTICIKLLFHVCHTTVHKDPFHMFDHHVLCAQTCNKQLADSHTDRPLYRLSALLSACSVLDTHRRQPSNHCAFPWVAIHQGGQGPVVITRNRATPLNHLVVLLFLHPLSISRKKNIAFTAKKGENDTHPNSFLHASCSKKIFYLLHTISILNTDCTVVFYAMRQHYWNPPVSLPLFS